MPQSASNFLPLEENAPPLSVTVAGARSKPLEAPRFGCAFSGAYEAVVRLRKAIPVAHAGGGCVFNSQLGLFRAGGSQGVGYAGGTTTPSCNLLENEVVFGGEDRLREQIKGTLELMEGDLYVVLGACIPAMIGDDVASVVREFRDETGAPLIHVNVPGFAGSSYNGYELLLKAVIDQFLERPTEKIRGLVNIIGIPPGLNPFWKGTYKELNRLLNRLGLKANLLFGPNDDVDSLKKLSAAELTVVVNPWLGVEAARLLEERFGVPYLVYPHIPVGPEATGEFLRSLQARLTLSPRKVARVIKEEEFETYWRLDQNADAVAMLSASLPFAVVADASTVLGITRYLVNEAGFIPGLAVITDNPPESARKLIDEQFDILEQGLRPEVIYEEDTFHIQNILKERNFGLLLASSLEKFLQTGAPFVQLTVSYPTNDRLIIDRSYAGYGGGINLLEDIFGKFIMPF